MAFQLMSRYLDGGAQFGEAGPLRNQAALGVHAFLLAHEVFVAGDVAALYESTGVVGAAACDAGARAQIR